MHGLARTLLLLAASQVVAADSPNELERVGALLAGGRHAEAEAAAGQLLRVVEAENGPESAPAADALDLLVEALWRGGKAREPQARQLAERAVEIRERLSRAAHPQGLPKSLNNLGLLLYIAQDHDAALPVLERAVAVAEAALGPEHPDLARNLNSLGTVFLRMGRYAEARRCYERALPILERNLGPDHAHTLKTVGNLGLLLHTLGRYGEAKLHLERALEAQTRSLGDTHADVASTLSNLGNLLADMGDLEAARSAYERAIAIRERLFGPEHGEVARALNNLATVLHESGERALALAQLERVLRIREKLYGPEDAAVGSTLNSLALLLVDMGQHARAQELYRRSLEIRERTLGPRHPLVSRTLQNLALLQHRTGDLEGAAQLFARSLSILEESAGPEHPEVALVLVGLARLAWDAGSRGEALAYASRAAGTIDAHAREALAYLPERQALGLVASRQHPEEVLFSGLLATGGEDESDRARWLEACWRWVLLRRGLVIEELAARRRHALDEASPEARAAWERLAAARGRLAELTVAGPDELRPASYRDDLDQARRRKEEAEAALARLGARHPRSTAAPDLDELRSALPRGSALVEIAEVPVRAPGVKEPELHLVALILDHGGPAGFADLGPAKRIDDLVAAWRDALEETSPVLLVMRDEPAESRLEQAGARLRRAFWDPIARLVRGAGTVFLVPDGSLHRVKVEALPTDEGRYLIESGPALHLLSSGRDLVRLRAAARAGRGVLALGAPDFDADETVRMARLEPQSGPLAFRSAPPSCAAFAAIHWASLRESGREAEQVALLFEGHEPVRLLLGAEASEERFKREAPGKRFLHLATHGFFTEPDCDTGHLARARAANPLLLSGLVLAGANQLRAARPSGEDGVLTAEEIAALDLGAVELAVLSACDTGEGQVAAGEGVFGLRRAFEVAGARAVLMSLWPVPDRQGRQWMQSFYERRLGGGSVLEASRQASLGALGSLRQQGRPTHPYLWAGFVAAGDWN